MAQFEVTDIEVEVNGEYYYLTLNVEAEADYSPGRFPSLKDPGEPEVRILEVTSVEILEVDGETVDEELKTTCKPGLEDAEIQKLIYETIWMQYEEMQEDNNGQD